MSEATIAITKLRQDKLNPHYRPMIFVIAPFTEVVKSDAKSTMTVRSYCRFIYQHGGIPVCPQLYLPQFINMHHSREFQVAAFINIVLLTKCAVKIKISATLITKWRLTKDAFYFIDGS